MDPAQELADLQNRFHLLEGDRKAFYEQSQLTLKQNKEACDALRRENKEVRAPRLSRHQRVGCSAGRAGGGQGPPLQLLSRCDRCQLAAAARRARAGHVGSRGPGGWP